VVPKRGYEQRQQPRAWCNLQARWEAVWGQQTGRVGDISTGGCLIRTTQKAPAVGDVLRIEIALAEDVRISAWGTVVHRTADTFGLRFKLLGEAERNAINLFIRKHGGLPTDGFQF
jgi:PilZ domain